MAGSGQRPVLRFDDGGWAEQVGNHLALDLVNTVAWRLDPDRTADRLSDGMAVLRWARFVGLVDDARAADFHQELEDDPELGSRVATQTRDLRERLYRALQPIAVRAKSAHEDFDGLKVLLLEVLQHADLVGVMPLHWTVPLRTVRELPTALGLSAWLLLEREDPQRIRQCRDLACGWLFLDQSKNSSRVWCSSSDCGNRSRARRHYQRHARTHAPDHGPER